MDPRDKPGDDDKESGMARGNQMLNGGQVIVDYLIREKVPYAFGLCGHGNIGFIDALYERADEIKTISSRHETVSGFGRRLLSGFGAADRDLHFARARL